jgi:putative inorganic carbon (hco3(-)) transporter
MKWFMESKHIVAMIVCISWIVLFTLSFLPGFDTIAWWVIAVAPALILLWYFIFDQEIFLFLTIFFIPLSIKLEMPAGFAIAFPSEFMAVMLVGYLAVNFSSLRIPDKRIFSHPIFIMLIVYIAWMLFASALSEMKIVSFKHSIIQILYLIVFYFLFLTRFDRLENIARFFLFYALGLIIPIANGMIWHSQYNFMQQASYDMPKPFFIEHTLYAASIAFVVPMLFYLVFIPNDFAKSLGSKILIAALLLLTITAEFLSYSRAAWYSLLVLPFFLLIIRLKIRQRILLAGILAITVVVLLNIDPLIEYIGRNEASSNRGDVREQFQSVSNIRSDISNLERINRWKCALRMFEEKPLAGWGPGTYQFIYGTYQVRSEMTRISTFRGDKGNAHSEYLGFLSESGVPGLLIYLVLILVVLSTALRVIYRVDNKQVRNLAIVVLLSLLTFYFHTIFNGFLETEKIGSLYYGTLAAITGLDVYFFKKSTG